MKCSCKKKVEENIVYYQWYLVDKFPVDVEVTDQKPEESN